MCIIDTEEGTEEFHSYSSLWLVSFLHSGGYLSRRYNYDDFNAH